MIPPECPRKSPRNHTVQRQVIEGLLNMDRRPWELERRLAHLLGWTELRVEPVTRSNLSRMGVTGLPPGGTARRVVPAYGTSQDAIHDDLHTLVAAHPDTLRRYIAWLLAGREAMPEPLSILCCAHAHTRAVALILTLAGYGPVPTAEGRRC